MLFGGLIGFVLCYYFIRIRKPKQKTLTVTIENKKPEHRMYVTPSKHPEWNLVWESEKEKAFVDGAMTRPNYYDKYDND